MQFTPKWVRLALKGVLLQVGYGKIVKKGVVKQR